MVRDRVEGAPSPMRGEGAARRGAGRGGGPPGRRAEPSGVLLVDKAAGHTSHDVVARARRCLGTRRIGHTGTLDPFATGLLLLCIGRATRLAEYFHLLDKSYEATLRLGVETDTHDPEGEVCARSDAWTRLTAAEVDRVLASWVGRGEQRPPAFSAKRLGGRRAHRLARAGAEPELEAEPIEVHALERVAWNPPELGFRLRASTGTYVRALARDVGRALGCGAFLAALRRTAIGPFSVEDAVAESGLDGAGPAHPAWRTPLEALSWLPARQLDEEEERRVVSGLPVAAAGVRPAGPGSTIRPQEGLPVLLAREDRLVAVAERRDGALRPRKVLVGP